MKIIRSNGSVFLLFTFLLPMAAVEAVGEPPHNLASIQTAIQPEAAPRMKNVCIAGNIFHPGELGVVNVPLSRWQNEGR